MFKGTRISLANKCQLMFGAAVILILVAALSVVWARMQNLVERAPRMHAQTIAKAWRRGEIHIEKNHNKNNHGMTVQVFSQKDLLQQSKKNLFLNNALKHFNTSLNNQKNSLQWFKQAVDEKTGDIIYLYAAALRGNKPEKNKSDNNKSDTIAPIQKVLLVRLTDPQALSATMLNRIYIVAAGLAAGLLAIGVFWFITTRIILSPVRLLRDYAQRVSQGNTNIRSDINTGDEFQELSDMFNAMLENLKHNEDQLRTTNKSLDLKLGKLEESNLALYEANKVKGEFLANVSHELRTPLNSIVGFAQVLEDALNTQIKNLNKNENNSKPLTKEGLEKRKRYASNILTSSSHLLELITELLDIAKIEAGRMDLNISSFSPTDIAEGLLNLMKPQASKKDIELDLNVAPNLPMIESDPGKVQQILFNFLSNAIKFTPRRGSVTLSTKLITEVKEDVPTRIRFAVIDSGIGIESEHQDRIFEKFTQIQTSETREQGGTGLGLTISKELAHMLGGIIEVESELKQGATFSLTIPVVYSPSSASLMPDDS